MLYISVSQERLQKAMTRARALSEKRKGGEGRYGVPALYCSISVFNPSPTAAQRRVNSGVAGRLIKGALWDQEARKRQRDEGDGRGDTLPQTKRPATSQ